MIKKNIIYIDDDKMSLDILKLILEDDNYNIFLADNQNKVDMIFDELIRNNQSLDLIIIDYNLNEINCEVLLINTQKKFGKTKNIVLTGMKNINFKYNFINNDLEPPIILSKLTNINQLRKIIKKLIYS